jgi:hypothetical protein
VRRQLLGHLVVLLAVLLAVGCAIASQYGVKNLVDVLDLHHPSTRQLWGAVALLLGLVAGDHLMWRLAGWIASYVFVATGGSLRLELFDHLAGHGAAISPTSSGALAARITTAAESAWIIENSLTWTAIPPAAAVLSSIAVLGFIDWPMALCCSSSSFAWRSSSPLARPGPASA